MNDTVRYEYVESGTSGQKPRPQTTEVKVFLGKCRIGTIKKAKVAHTVVGWQYTPKGHKEGGEIFPSLILCQKSLEEEE